MKSLIVVLMLCASACAVDLEVLHEWNLLDYNFPDYEYASKYR